MKLVERFGHFSSIYFNLMKKSADIEKNYRFSNTFCLYQHRVKYEQFLYYSHLKLQNFKRNTLYMHHQKQMNGLKVPQKETRPVSNGHSIQECSRSSASCQPQQHAVEEGFDCPWLGCKTSCETISDFLNHVNREHVLNRNSLLEIRVQVLK